MSVPVSILEIPSDIVSTVFQFLPPKSIARCAQVCTLWKEFADDPAVWQAKCIEAWQVDVPVDLFFSCHWKQYFRKRSVLETNISAGRRSVRSLRGHTENITALAKLGTSSVLSVDVVTASGDNTIRVWNATTATLVREISTLGSLDVGTWPLMFGDVSLANLSSVSCFRPSPTKSLFYARGLKGAAVIDAASGAMVRTLSRSAHVSWFNDTALLVSEKTCKIVDVMSGHPLAEYVSATSQVTAAASFIDSSLPRASDLVAVGHEDGTLVIWNTRENKIIQHVTKHSVAPVQRIVIEDCLVLAYCTRPNVPLSAPCVYVYDAKKNFTSDAVSTRQLQATADDVEDSRLFWLRGDEILFCGPGGICSKKWRDSSAEVKTVVAEHGCFAMDDFKIVVGLSSNNVAILDRKRHTVLLTMMGGSTVIRGPVSSYPTFLSGISSLVLTETSVIATTGMIVKIFDFVPIDFSA